MRILSQDGLKFDISYERCHLVVNEKRCEIEAETGCENFALVMASYGSIEQCRKAMDMLRKAYSPVLSVGVQGNEVIPDIRPSDLIITNKLPTSSITVCDNFYFRFPTESELED